MIKQIFFGLIGAFAINTSYAATFTINENGESIGQSKQVTLKKGESLSTVAKRYGITISEVIAANPNFAGEKRLPAGTKVSILSRYLLPSGPQNGIILNLAELKIYYFHPDGKTVSIYPVAAGKQGWSTPQGTTTIVAKQKDPAWRPPMSIRRESARRGRSLPLVIPPGPHNPLGRYAMRLGISGILIHGTNKPQSIGTRCSHGCIRMHAKDIKELFSLVAVGTDVRIVSETKSQIAAKQAAARLAAETQRLEGTQTEATTTAQVIHTNSSETAQVTKTVVPTTTQTQTGIQTTTQAQTVAPDTSTTGQPSAPQNVSSTANSATNNTENNATNNAANKQTPRMQDSGQTTHNENNTVPATQQNPSDSTHAQDIKNEQQLNNEQASSKDQDTKS